MVEEDLTREIIGAAVEVHRYWGPGLLEEIYERSLLHELASRGLSVEQQMPLPLSYKGREVGNSLRVDLLVSKKVVVELKAVAELLPIHEAQLFTYLRLTRCRVGLLINFNTLTLTDGIRRVVL
jgi:GxxExxY protein